MKSIGSLEKCEVCGREILVERIVNGVNHTLQVIITCWECLSKEAKQKAKGMYRVTK